MTTANPDIDTLVTLCRQGSRNAQFEVYNRYYKPMYNTALRIVKDSHWAEDIMQEAFLKAFTKIESFKGEVTFGAWLKKIVVNHSLDTYKKVNRNAMDSLDDILYKAEDESSAEAVTLDFQQLKVQQVMAAIQLLKENYRIILTLLYIEGYDHDEICDVLAITPGNCRTTISRAKESLLKKMNAL